MIMIINKSLFICFLIIFQLKCCKSVKDNMLPLPGRSSETSDVYHIVKEWLDEVVKSGIMKNVLPYIVNFNFALTSPAIYLNTDSNHPYLGETDKHTPFCFFINNMSGRNIEPAVKTVQKYINSKYVQDNMAIVISTVVPNRVMIDILRNNSFQNVLYAIVQGKVLLYDWSLNLVTSDVLMLVDAGKPASFKICYYDSTSPYTSMPDGTMGIENELMKLAGQYLNINITYMATNMAKNICEVSYKETLLGFLNNRSCDGVTGPYPCDLSIRSFDISSAYLEDGSILVAPNLKCRRNIGWITVDPLFMILVLCVIFLVCVVGFLLFLYQSDGIFNLKAFIRSLPTLFSRNKGLATSLIVILVSIFDIVISGYFQGIIFQNLVNENHICDIKSVDDIIGRNLSVGLDAMISENILGKGFGNALRQLSYIDDNFTSLDSADSHIIREVLFRHILPRYYLKENGDVKFRIVQHLKRFQRGMIMYKKHPLSEDINFAILTIHHSGIHNHLLERTFGSIRLEDIVRQSQYLYYYTPIQLRDINTLIIIWIVCLFVSTLVFFIEIFWAP